MDPRPDSPPSSLPPGDADPSLHAPADEPAAMASGDPATPVSVSPVETGPAIAVGGSRTRWLIGGGVAVTAVAALVFAAALVGARPLPDVLKYVPSDSAIVVELRPELPGDQRQKIGNFLANFPGFDDQAILDQKLDEAFDRIVRESSRGAVDYATQVKPLLAGPIALSVSAGALRNLTPGGTSPGFLFVATTDGNATCGSVFGATTLGEAYRDAELRVVDGSRSVACALDGRYLLVGDADAIRDGLDARRDGKGVDGSSAYRTAREALDGDQLATVYANGTALRDLLLDAGNLLGQPFPQAALAPWTVAGLRVVDDALVLDAYAPPVPVPSLPSGVPSVAPAAESRFAASLPSDTLGFVEIHGVGALAARGLAVLRADPAQAEALAPIEGALGMVGGVDNLVGWIEELGIAVLPSEDAVGGALLIRGTDADAAASRVTQVRNLLVLASTGTDMTVRDTDRDGVTITSVDLGDTSTLFDGLGVPAGGVGDVRLQFAIAARDDLVVVGYGQGVVERILDVDPASSLRSTASYSRAVQLSGSTNDVQLYVAIDSTIALIERLVPSGELEAFNRDTKPYLAPFAATSWSSTTGATENHARFVLTVK